MAKEMATIERLAGDYREAHDLLNAAVRQCEAELQAVKRRHRARLRRLAASAADRRGELTAAVEARPEAFKRPKTRTFHGIRVGWVKGKGRIAWSDADQVVRLIEKHFPERAGRLVKTTKRPVREALNRLTTAELKRIGCTVEESAEEVLVKVTDGEIDKLVDALLADAEGREETP